jgi:predicted Zn-dependent protease
MTTKRAVFLPTLLLFSQLSGCAVNAVTGERNFQLYGSDWEQQVGAQMYVPMKQSQGGDFVIDPELTAYVDRVGKRLAAQARRKEELQFEFSIINSSVPNAWALPGGKIVVNRGLLTRLDSEAELAAVLGHEIVHADAAHGARQQSSGMLAQLGAVASMVVLGSTVENQAAREIAMQVPMLGAQLIMQRYGRDAERESDEYGMLYMSEAGYDPQGAVRLQETFVKLSEGRNEDWLSGLFASHPPSGERLENNRKTAASLPAEGELGRQRYQEATASVRRVEPAYEAFDEASKAVSEGQLELAQGKLDQALKLEPRESLFHALQGDIYALRERPEQALKSYDRAIRANEGFFYGYLRKGQLEYRQKHKQSARTNLEKSLGLLPTAEAHYLLGLLDRDSGNTQASMEHLKLAAQSTSDAGNSARKELILLDIGQNPSAYIASKAVLDPSNRVWVLLGNRTDVAMRNIEVSYAWLDESGRTRQGKKVFPGPLAGGKEGKLRMDQTLSVPAELDSRFRAQVTAAEVAE